MKANRFGILVVLLTLAIPLAGNARDHGRGGRRGSIRLVGVVPVPNNPIISSDIGWTDPGTERVYIADRSNFGVDILDAENNLFVGRVAGMAGPLPSGGGTPYTNGPGPNGVLVTPDGILWAGDGNATATVADVNPRSPNYLLIIAAISTAIADCDVGDAHYCGRADELGYDPEHHIILIANNAPLDTVDPHGPIAPYVTFISADPPYPVLGHISFPGSTGLEQPLWDPGLDRGRFLLTVPGNVDLNLPPRIAVIDPVTEAFETMDVDCQRIVGTTSASITGIALGRSQHILISACGAGAIPSLPIILNARNGEVISVMTEVGGGDEVWFNPGADEFYVTGVDRTGATGLQSLGIIDARRNRWLQNLTDVRGKNPSALPENTHIFTVVQITQAIVDDPSLDDSTCAVFGYRGTGCVALFAPEDDD